MGIGYPRPRRASRHGGTAGVDSAVGALLLALSSAAGVEDVARALVPGAAALVDADLAFVAWGAAAMESAGDRHLALRPAPAEAIVGATLGGPAPLQPLRDAGAAHVLAVPLPDLAGGYLAVGRSDDRRFRRQDVATVEEVARHGAVALRRAEATDSLRAALARVHDDAQHDPLTGLSRRDLFDQRVLAAPGPVAILLLDLDGLAEINDALGHRTGDVVLTMVADRLVRELPGARSISRIGGTQFAMAIDVASRHQALGFARRAQEAVSAQLALPDMALEVSAVVGVAVSQGQPDVEALLDDAGAALRGAKRRRISVDEHDPGAGHDGGLVPGALREAVRRGGLVVEYQPIVALDTGQTAAAEALVRWHHPSRGLLPPGDFLPRVELIGLSTALTQVVLAAALERCRQWRAAGAPSSVAVNLSGRVLHDARLPDAVAAALDRVNVPSEALTLEVSESTAMAAPERTSAVLQRLAARGVRLALDDVGTGFSSLPLLRALPLTELKIDRTLVASCATDDDSAAVVEGAIGLAHRLDRRVVAEGVEDQATYVRLREAGCDRAQGFWIGRPMPGDRMAGWLDSWGARLAAGTIAL